MNPNTVFSASLVTSLVLWFPSMQACLRGDLDLAPAGLRYLAALLVSRLVMTGLAHLVGAYRSGHEAPDAIPSSGTPVTESDVKGETGPPRRRRRDDAGTAGDGAAEAA